jgi:hypothetical protein
LALLAGGALSGLLENKGADSAIRILGTVRLREGNYLSAPITLGAVPQTVTFPIPRSETISPSDVIVIEGDATNVVLASPLTSWQKLFESVHGVTAFETRWSPSKN